MCQQYWPRMTFFESNSSVIPLSKHTQNKNAARRSTQVSLMFASALLSWLQMLLAFEAEVPMTDLIYWGLSRIMLWFFLIIWKSVKTRHDEVNPKQISFKQLQILRKIPSTLIVRTSMVLVSTIVHLFCLESLDLEVLYTFELEARSFATSMTQKLLTGKMSDALTALKDLEKYRMSLGETLSQWLETMEKYMLPDCLWNHIFFECWIQGIFISITPLHRVLEFISISRLQIGRLIDRFVCKQCCSPSKMARSVLLCLWNVV